MDIVRFKGGLGNQMFQYALLKSLASKNRNVAGSLGHYIKPSGKRPFCLKNVFKNVSFYMVDEMVFEEINRQWKEIKQNERELTKFLTDYPNRFFWVEDPVGVYDKHIYETHNCTFVGFWQTEKYFIQIKEELIKDFQFFEGEKVLSALKKMFCVSEKYISVHVRRGDYLKNPEIYGDICTEQYYKKAIQLIKKKISDPVFVFFSDDIEWVKNRFWSDDAIYIEESMFKHYQAWYDMCLMSCCSHNIIANSTFSWWGAWLNNRVDRIVIAPRKWANGQYDLLDICPESWVRI